MKVLLIIAAWVAVALYLGTHPRGELPSGVAQILGWIGRRWCALRGHDALLNYGAGRLNLLCTSCGHESPGITTEKRKTT